MHSLHFHILLLLLVLLQRKTKSSSNFFQIPLLILRQALAHYDVSFEMVSFYQNGQGLSLSFTEEQKHWKLVQPTCTKINLLEEGVGVSLRFQCFTVKFLEATNIGQTFVNLARHRFLFGFGIHFFKENGGSDRFLDRGRRWCWPKDQTN